MPRLMSVALTTDAVRSRQKTVTRRLGWKFLKPGDRLTLCEKVQGRKKGEPLVRICDVEVVSVGMEPLAMVSKKDVVKEGFPDMEPWEFMDFMRRELGVPPWKELNRIEWRYLE